MAKKKPQDKTKDKSTEKEPAPVEPASSLTKAKVRSVTLVSSESLKRGKSRSKSGLFEHRASEIPTKGSQLLDWVRKRMSYVSDEDIESSEEEEVQETVKDKKKKTHQPAAEDKDEKKTPTKPATATKKGKVKNPLKTTPLTNQSHLFCFQETEVET
ncbi:uncharacterized protein LOC123320354 [Coccinella septempunctata]|uniref:uncharacterized protein LOC123320354 n=1 Tax=Coccinella septempunctata TaxID=41139 RepID=UPI001D088BFC|nr:uncharacterized protein LOC123320354 [Coccinella septempunctata]